MNIFNIFDQSGNNIGNISKLKFGPNETDCIAQSPDGSTYKVVWVKEEQPNKTKVYEPNVLYVHN